MAKQATITVPESLVPELEAWGKMTAKVFGELRRYAGIKPKGVPKNQEWYWSEKWQKWEREADEAEARGDYKEFDNVGDAIDYLHSNV